MFKMFAWLAPAKRHTTFPIKTLLIAHFVFSRIAPLLVFVTLVKSVKQRMKNY